VQQLITRIDQELHRRLKQRAAAEGRSVNAMVVDILRSAVHAHDERELVRARIRALGRRARVPRPRRVPSREAISALTRGLGTAASDALAAERQRR
jgi:plasmid stability protein